MGNVTIKQLIYLMVAATALITAVMALIFSFVNEHTGAVSFGSGIIGGGATLLFKWLQTK